MMKILFVFLLLLNSSLAACPSGSIAIPSSLGSKWSCLSVIAAANTFTMAELQCQQSNGHLISVSNGFFNAWLAQEVHSVQFDKATVTSKYWIGVSSLNGNGWQNNDDGSNTNYFDWAPRQPANQTESNGCVSVDTKGGWYNDNCFASYSFACEVPEVGMTTTPAKTMVSTTRSSVAPTIPSGTCTGQDCETYTFDCSANPDCVCYQTPNGSFCGIPDECTTVPDCSQCTDPGSICLLNTCCGDPICVPLSSGDTCTTPPTAGTFKKNKPSIFQRPVCKENKDCPLGTACKRHTVGSFCV